MSLFYIVVGVCRSACEAGPKNTRGEAGGRLVPLGLDTTRHDTTRRIKGAKNPSRSSVGLHGAVDAPCCTACLRVLSCKKQGKTAIGISSKRQQRQEQQQTTTRSQRDRERIFLELSNVRRTVICTHPGLFECWISCAHYPNTKELEKRTTRQQAHKGKNNNDTGGEQQLRLGHQQLIAWLQTHW